MPRLKASTKAKKLKRLPPGKYHAKILKVRKARNKNAFRVTLQLMKGNKIISLVERAG